MSVERKSPIPPFAISVAFPQATQALQAHNTHEGDGSMAPPSASVSPRYSNQPLHSRSDLTRDGRLLPSKNVTDEDIDDSFAKFVLYCNPHYSSTTETTELKRVFRNPPRSDGKDFSIFRLFELLQKYERKEIKTWNQVALDLGVEPPTTENGGSTQKVQQYSVRLKRWLRAMHVDAFFDYLQGKDHPYFLDIPPIMDPFPTHGRDGVPTEEDLALRALDPTFKPKRGRKRNESPDEESSESKRPMLTTSFSYDGQTMYAQPQSAYPDSAILSSAHPDNMSTDPMSAAFAVTSQGFGMRTMTPHSAVNSSPHQHLRWHLNGLQGTPVTPHPLSAITNSGLHDVTFDEPQSAVTPHRARQRRKHGPAVSSAWPSGGSSTSKIRGRPPGNRSVQDGPFSTFPVTPTVEGCQSHQPSTTPIALSNLPEAVRPPIPNRTLSTTSQGRRERERLQLQVPQHTGGPVRLMTPETITNNELDTHTLQPNSSADPFRPSFPLCARSSIPDPKPQQQQTQPTPSNAGHVYESLKRALASDLLRSHVRNRPSSRLTVPEAKSLADAMLARLKVPTQDPESEKVDALRIAAVNWLGLSSALGIEGPVAAAGGGSKVVAIRRFEVDGEGYQIPLVAENLVVDGGKEINAVFDVHWSLTFGGVNADFSVRGIEIDEDGTKGDKVREVEARAMAVAESVKGKRDDEVDWKGKFRALEMGLMVMKGQLEEAREKVLDVMLNV